MTKPLRFERTSREDLGASKREGALGKMLFDGAYSKACFKTVSQEGFMKFCLKVILAAVLLSAVPIALGQDAATDVKKGAEKTGHETKVVAKDTAKGTEKGAKATGHETKKVAKTVGKDTEKGAEKTGHETKVVAKDTAKGTEKVAKKTGSGVKKGTEATGHEVKKAGEKMEGDKPKPQ